MNWTRSVKCSFLNTEHWDYDIKITNGFLLRTGESNLSPFWQFWLIFLKRKHDSRSRHHWKKTPDGEWQGWATSLKFWVEVSRTIQRAHLWLKHLSSHIYIHIYIWNYLSRKLKRVTIFVKGLFSPSSFHKALDDCAQPSQCAPPPPPLLALPHHYSNTLIWKWGDDVLQPLRGEGGESNTFPHWASLP